MLQRGGHVPHFDVEQMDGSRARYGELWQLRNLLLLSLPDDDGGEFVEYATRLAQRQAEFTTEQTALVVTRAGIAGVPRPGVVIADRWGEIYSVVDARTAPELPTVDDLLEWFRYIQHACPECEGEAK
jgi:hypothetical protein